MDQRDDDDWCKLDLLIQHQATVPPTLGITNNFIVFKVQRFVLRTLPVNKEDSSVVVLCCCYPVIRIVIQHYLGTAELRICLVTVIY